MGIGENIKRRRRELNMTLEEVASRVGVSRQTLSRYETGIIGNIPSDKIETLARILHTTPSALMGWENNKPAAPKDDELVDSVIFNRNGKTVRRKYPKEQMDAIQKMLDAMPYIVDEEI